MARGKDRRDWAAHLRKEIEEARGDVARVERTVSYRLEREHWKKRMLEKGRRAGYLDVGGRRFEVGYWS